MEEKEFIMSVLIDVREHRLTPEEAYSKMEEYASVEVE